MTLGHCNRHKYESVAMCLNFDHLTMGLLQCSVKNDHVTLSNIVIIFKIMVLFGLKKVAKWAEQLYIHQQEFAFGSCNFYAFCGALFGITSMMTLLAISVDRYCVITKPLQSLKRSTKKRSCIIIMFVWLYSLGWSVCPLFGWSSYIPEGLMISCTWDYVSYSPSNRSYTMLLCWCVFFIPLMIIFHCYLFMFLTIRSTGSSKRKKSSSQSIKNEWKLAKVAFVAIVVYVVSWSPYACVTLIAWAGYARVLTPYSKSVPAVIAKASAIHNPIIYAIIHPSYRYCKFTLLYSDIFEVKLNHCWIVGHFYLNYFISAWIPIFLAI
uniref:G-protein coupled receptors family 1 profile domain-containing protein n=1 Tax=Laticauda laticaudata TaxID=8630 RepID=A0A8C5SR64_LATLA